jgi:hypothetical protein
MVGFMWLVGVGVGVAWLTGGIHHIIEAPATLWLAMSLQASLPYLLASSLASAAERPISLALAVIVGFLLLSLVAVAVVPGAVSPMVVLHEPFGFSAATRGMYRASVDPGRDIYWVAVIGWIVVTIWCAPIGALVGQRGKVRRG